jgi:hypothetical protein
MRLTINHHPIDLDEKAKVNLTLINPAFDEALVARVFTFPFTLPTTGANARALGHAYRLDVRAAETVLPASIQLDSGLTVDGSATIGTVRNNRIEATFKNAPRVSADVLNDTKLNEIMGALVVPQTVLPYWKYAFIPTPFALSFEIYMVINGETYGSTIYVPANYPAALAQLAADINVDYPGMATYNASNNTIDIFPTLEQLPIDVYTPPQTLQDPYGRTDLLNEYEFRTLGQSRLTNFKDFIDGALVTPLEEVTFPMVKMARLFHSGEQTKNPFHKGAINANRDYSYLVTNAQSEDLANGYSYPIIPFLRIPYILDRIADRLGLTGWGIVGYDNSLFEKAYLYNGVCLEDSQRERKIEFWRNTFDVGQPLDPNFPILYAEFVQYLYYATEIDLNNHVPDISIKTFLNEFCKLLNVWIDVRTDQMVLTPKVNQMRNSATDITQFVTEEYEMERSTGPDTQLAWANDPNDGYPRAPTELLPVGDGTPFYLPAPMPMASISTRLYGSISTVGTNYIGKSTVFGITANSNNAIRINFDVMEYYSGGNGGEWQGLTSTHYGIDAAGVRFSDIDLELPGEYGLYDRFWREWMPILRADDLTLYSFMPTARISNLQEWIFTKMILYHNQGQTTLLPAEISISEAADDRDSLIKLTLKKI